MSFMNPGNWFYTRRTPSAQDPQNGRGDFEPDRLVVEAGELDDSDFMAVNVRPLTYAEASEQRLPAANRRIVSAEPYSNVDEEKLAVQAVDEYIQRCEKNQPSASVHVTASIEYDLGNGGEIHTKRNRHKRNRRRSSTAKTAAAQMRRENSKARDKLKSQSTVQNAII